MANKKISELTSYTSPVSGDVLPINDTTNTTTKKVTVDNLLNVLSSLFRIKDPTDTTKKVAFDVSGVTTATTRTITVPDADLTMVGTSTTQTLTNKTLTSPTINLGSDAEGDTYYRNSSGAFVRLPRGTDNYILKMNGNVPNWEVETVTVDASTTVKGIVEVATSSEVTAGTATGGTGAVLVVTPDALASSTPTFSGLGITNSIVPLRIAGYTPASNTTENTVFSTTINANTLSTNGLIEFNTPIYFGTNATAETWTIRLKFGGSTLQTITVSCGAIGGGTATTSYGELRGVIMNNASTSSQNVGFYISLSPNYSSDPANDVAPTMSHSNDTTSAVNTTLNQTLSVTVQRSNGGGGSGGFYQTIVKTIKNA